MDLTKGIIISISLLFLSVACKSQTSEGSADDQRALRATTEAIRKGFAKGDVAAVLALHHPDIAKYFGGKNIVRGREGLKKQLTDLFNYANVEFVQNDIESTIFNENTVIETCIYGIRLVPKNGNSTSIIHGRSMVVYVRYKDSPTGWASLREMTQDAPGNNK
jgi:ketosteroid isomerase-like protein